MTVSKEIKYLGVVRANPAEYVEKYGSTLVTEMPEFVKEIATPAEVGVLAADYKAKSLVELEGELEGFQYVDLDKEGLGEYRSYLSNLGRCFVLNEIQVCRKYKIACENLGWRYWISC